MKRDVANRKSLHDGHESRELGDDPHQVVASVAVRFPEFDKFTRTRNQDGSLGGARNCRRLASSSVKDAFIAELPDGPQHGVRVHAKYSSEIPCLRNFLSRCRLPLRDGATDGCCDLLVQEELAFAVDRRQSKRVAARRIDIRHETNHSSVMTILIERPTTAVEGDLAEPISAEVLFAEARQRARRRRNFVIIAMAVVFALVVAGTVVIAQTWAHHPTIAQRPAPAFSTGSDGFPTTMVVWEAPTAHHENGIEVIDSTTGKTVRTLVKNTGLPGYQANPTNPLAYVYFGFDLTNDGSRLYFNADREIESVGANGGHVSRIAAGTHPVVSPDGTTLAYRPNGSRSFEPFGTGPTFAVRDLQSGKTELVTMPGVRTGQKVTVAWLPDSTHLLLHASDLTQCTGGTACPTHATRNPQWSSSTQILDTASGTFAPVPAATAAALHESASIMPQLEGAGTNDNQVRVSAVVSPETRNSFTELGTLDIATGVVDWKYRLPRDFRIGFDVAQLRGQDSGDHFILDNDRSPGLRRWSPTVSNQPVPVGRTPRVLTLGDYWVSA